MKDWNWYINKNEKIENISRDLKPNEIKRCREYFETLTLTITEIKNLFWLNLNKKILFNIGSGKSASKQTALILLSVTDIGSRACEEFIK